jgi:hypothetical protein
VSDFLKKVRINLYISAASISILVNFMDDYLTVYMKTYARKNTVEIKPGRLLHSVVLNFAAFVWIFLPTHA